MHVVDPDDDPAIEQTLTQMLMCRNAPYGCKMVFTYQPGLRDRARKAKRVHEDLCAYRFHQPQEPA